MVGVKEHRESRLVVESDWKVKELEFNMRGKITTPVNCDGWVLGKGNFRVFFNTTLDYKINSDLL
jgi:hypothetical protein